ncbi:FAD/NAD(P)-binding domain-containing protein [Hesseltinella vesiculosa]|uniref:Sulfide:quinone oxidoreductase, mitochondrial n=1 Tax=Hesseltinella vesiculosa TaxID=101127 RepID=A0A1X2GAW2_9FUNG|nr:FAD/NAD(P)-binding domain-containing protein [Hesseltinella vesiculosa]
MFTASRVRLANQFKVRTFATQANKNFRVVVVGAGPGGLSVSSTLSELLGKDQVAVIEPSDKHYYQPLWTYVGGGLKDFNESVKPMGSVMPSEAEWIQDRVTKLDPDNNQVELSNGERVGYDYLVVAAGIQINWDQVKGLKEALGKDGVTSNYSVDSVKKTYPFIQDFKGGNAVFTFPNTPLKCPGAPTKITFLAEEAFRLNGVRDKTNVIYNTSLGKIFGVDHYGKVLQRLADERGIQMNFQTELIEIDAANKEATFRNNANQAITKQPYDFLHVAPPQGPPSFIKESKLADAAGWVDVNKETLRHNKYANVYALGDCSSLPTSKTAAAITGESGVLKTNLIADLKGEKIEAATYDGYTSCPLIVGRQQLILAEFSGYTGQPLETFPVDQRQISNVSQYINKEIIPSLYWGGLLNGTWTGPSKVRNALKCFRPANLA